ncbi:MAG: DUF349 domain-containing protein [Chromatiales bacterium]|nr:DUF349 domain-containing protein [Chromatiales bacterium]
MLSRFFRPKWEHPNPKVRAAAVAELANDPERLDHLAREDDAPEVRCAALARVSALAVLEQVSVWDKVDSVRRAASDRLREVLCAEAGQAPDLDSRLQAVRRSKDPNLAEYLAKHAREPALRIALIDNLSAADHLAMALNDPAVDVRLAATEVLSDEADLERIAKVAKQADKRLYRLAKQRLETYRLARERRERIAEIADQLAAFADAIPEPLLSQRFAALSQEWAGLSDEAAQADRERVDAASAVFAERVGAQERARAGQRAVLDETSTLLSGLGEHPPHDADGYAQLREQWQGLRGRWDEFRCQVEAEQEKADRRFFVLAGELENALNRGLADLDRVASLQTLLKQGEQLRDRDKAISDIDIQRWSERWKQAVKPAQQALAAPLQERFQGLGQSLSDRLLRQAQKRDEHLQSLAELIEQLPVTLDAGHLQEAISLRDRLRHLLREIGDPGKLKKRIDKVLRDADARINELRGWRSWGISNARQALCDQAESLIESELPIGERAEKVRAVRDGWKRLDRSEGAASEAVWARFNELCNRAYAPCQEHFDQERENREENLEKRRVLCQEVSEWLSQQNLEQPDWAALRSKERSFKDRWRDMGPSPRNQRKAVDKEWDGAMAPLLAVLDKERDKERRRREALIRRVKELAEAEDLAQAIQQTKDAQAQWRPTVDGPRKQEQALWTEFRAACDAVFQRRDSERQAADQERRDNLDRGMAMLAELGDMPLTSPGELGQARHRLEEVEVALAELNPLPKGAEAELQRSAKEHGRRLDQAEKDLGRARKQAMLDNLRERSQLCARLEAMVLLQAVEEEARNTIEERWQALENLPKDWMSAMQSRYQQAVAAADGDDLAGHALAAAAEQATQARSLLCLRMEIARGVESPQEAREERMAYQVARLSDALVGSETSERPEQILREWFILAPGLAEADAPLLERFERAAGADYAV